MVVDRDIYRREAVFIVIRMVQLPGNFFFRKDYQTIVPDFMTLLVHDVTCVSWIGPTSSSSFFSLFPFYPFYI